MNVDVEFKEIMIFSYLLILSFCFFFYLLWAILWLLAWISTSFLVISWIKEYLIPQLIGGIWVDIRTGESKHKKTKKKGKES